MGRSETFTPPGFVSIVRAFERTSPIASIHRYSAWILFAGVSRALYFAITSGALPSASIWRRSAQQQAASQSSVLVHHLSAGIQTAVGICDDVMDCTNVITVPRTPFKQVVLPMIVVSDVVGRALELSFLIRKASWMLSSPEVETEIAAMGCQRSTLLSSTVTSSHTLISCRQ